MAPSLLLDDDWRMAEGLCGGEQSVIQLLGGIFVHGGENMGVGVQGSEYQISSHIGPSRYFFSGGGVLSISL